MKYLILILTTFFSRLQIDKCAPGYFDYNLAILCILSGWNGTVSTDYYNFRRKI